MKTRKKHGNRHAQRRAATHQKLLDALREVVFEKGYNDVDVLDITDRADVSKATFYQHFNNKEDALQELMINGFEALKEEIFAPQHTLSEEDWRIGSLRHVFAWAEENRPFMLIMVGGAATTQLNQFGRSYMADIVRQNLKQFPDETLRHPHEFHAQVVTGVLIQILGWWLENDTGYSALEIAQLVESVLVSALALPGDAPTLSASKPASNANSEEAL